MLNCVKKSIVKYASISEESDLRSFRVANRNKSKH